jgi:hypothetical protein
VRAPRSEPIHARRVRAIVGARYSCRRKERALHDLRNGDLPPGKGTSCALESGVIVEVSVW